LILALEFLCVEARCEANKTDPDNLRVAIDECICSYNDEISEGLDFKDFVTMTCCSEELERYNVIPLSFFQKCKIMELAELLEMTFNSIFKQRRVLKALEKTPEYQAAGRIQAAMTSNVSRKACFRHGIDTEEYSALQIQSGLRGWKTRLMVHKALALEEQAAIIQAGFRGCMSGKEVRGKRARTEQARLVWDTALTRVLSERFS